ncbi:MAG TPA: hypothetical protein VIT92_14840 [Burkholderiaceae bacterium]
MPLPDRHYSIAVSRRLCFALAGLAVALVIAAVQLWCMGASLAAGAAVVACGAVLLMPAVPTAWSLNVGADGISLNFKQAQESASLLKLLRPKARSPTVHHAIVTHNDSVRLLPCAVLSPYVLSLAFAGPGGRCRRLVLPDSMAADDFRALIVALKASLKRKSDAQASVCDEICRSHEN